MYQGRIVDAHLTRNERMTVHGHTTLDNPKPGQTYIEHSWDGSERSKPHVPTLQHARADSNQILLELALVIARELRVQHVSRVGHDV